MLFRSLRVLEIVDDITEGKRAEEQLSVIESAQRALIGAERDAVFLTNADDQPIVAKTKKGDQIRQTGWGAGRRQRPLPHSYQVADQRREHVRQVLFSCRRRHHSLAKAG